MQAFTKPKTQHSSNQMYDHEALNSNFEQTQKNKIEKCKKQTLAQPNARMKSAVITWVSAPSICIQRQPGMLGLSD